MNNKLQFLFFLDLFVFILFLIFHKVASTNILLLENINNNHKNQFSCGFDYNPEKTENYYVTIIPLEESNLNPNLRKNIRNLRTEQKEEEIKWRNIQIFIDQSELIDLTPENSFLLPNINITKQALEESSRTLEELLLIKDRNYLYSFNDSELSIKNIKKWDKNYFGDGTTFPYDLVIFPRFSNESELKETITATASNYYYDPETKRPILGKIIINTNIDFNKKNTLEYLKSVFIHEITHILGFNIYDIEKNYPENYIAVKDSGHVYLKHIVNSPKVIEVAKKYFACDSIDGVELEDNKLISSGSHWESRILLGEYMNRVQYFPEYAISEFTLALLEDSGWYKANYYTGGLMRFGKGAGCDFLNQPCVKDGKVQFKNEYFEQSNLKQSSCSSGRQSRTYTWLNYCERIPTYQQYFSRETLGGYEDADYCPVNYYNYEEEAKTYFVGNCKIGTGEYGSIIHYKNSKNFVSNSQFPESLGEKYGDNSFCALSSLTKENDQEAFIYKDTVHAICYPMFCSSSSMTIQINDDFIVCPREGGKVNVIGYDGYLLCPDYNLICGGSVMCNNMFDCVKKKSIIKEESYIYDYEKRTNQDIKDSESEFVNVGYELSNDGVCPKNCAQCTKNGSCFYKKNQ